MRNRKISRRQALRLAGGSALAALLFPTANAVAAQLSGSSTSTAGTSFAPAMQVNLDQDTVFATATGGARAEAPYHALDTDFGAAGVQGQRWFDAAKRAGYDGLITTLHTYWGGNPVAWGSAPLVLERALAAGLWIGAYGRPAAYWREALAPLPTELRERLKFYALDIEVEPGNTQFPMQRAYADGVADEFGVRPVVYTGWGMWGDVMGYGSGGFADLPLWDFSGDRADWPAALSDDALVPFAGWNTADNLRTGWQVQMQTPATLNGVTIDRDLFSRAFIDAV